MKIAFLFFVCSAVIIFSKAQNICIAYNSMGAGNNISTTFSKENEKIEFGAGLGCNLNKKSYLEENSHIFHKRQYSNTFLQFINFNAFINEKIFKKSATFQPFVFYDLQVRYSFAKVHYFESFDNQNFFLEIKKNYGPFGWVENNLGIGFKINFSKKMYLQKRFGIGAHFIIGKDNKISPRKDLFSYEFTNLFSIGLGYFLSK